MAAAVLYELNFQFHFWPLVLLACFVLLSIPVRRKVRAVRRQKLFYTPKNTYFFRGKSIAYHLALFLFVLLTLCFYLDCAFTYREAVRRVERREYVEVEGVVEDFQSSAFWIFGEESFTIAGETFHYRDMAAEVGYHTTRSHGGQLCQGKRIRMRYLPLVGNQSNRIVYIEELTEEPRSSPAS